MLSTPSIDLWCFFVNRAAGKDRENAKNAGLTYRYSKRRQTTTGTTTILRVLVFTVRSNQFIRPVVFIRLRIVLQLNTHLHYRWVYWHPPVRQ